MGNEEFHIKLLNDIKETGYPLELKIANKFRNNSWQLKYNSYYVDKDEKKGREIDLISNTLRAFPEKDTSESEKDKYPYLEVNLSLIIEIKESRDKPWVVFTTEKTLRDSNFPIIGHYPGLDKRKVRKIFHLK